jgi:hypothetical protein
MIVILSGDAIAQGMQQSPGGIRRVEIPVEGCIGGAGSRILIIDADDTLDIVVESPMTDDNPAEREIIYSWIKEPEL